MGIYTVENGQFVTTSQEQLDALLGGNTDNLIIGYVTDHLDSSINSKYIFIKSDEATDNVKINYFQDNNPNYDVDVGTAGSNINGDMLIGSYYYYSGYQGTFRNIIKYKFYGDRLNGLFPPDLDKNLIIYILNSNIQDQIINISTNYFNFDIYSFKFDLINYLLQFSYIEKDNIFFTIHSQQINLDNNFNVDCTMGFAYKSNSVILNQFLIDSSSSPRYTTTSKIIINNQQYDLITDRQWLIDNWYIAPEEYNPSFLSPLSFNGDYWYYTKENHKQRFQDFFKQQNIGHNLQEGIYDTEFLSYLVTEKNAIKTQLGVLIETKYVPEEFMPKLVSFTAESLEFVDKLPEVKDLSEYSLALRQDHADFFLDTLLDQARGLLRLYEQYFTDNDNSIYGEFVAKCNLFKGQRGRFVIITKEKALDIGLIDILEYNNLLLKTQLMYNMVGYGEVPPEKIILANMINTNYDGEYTLFNHASMVKNGDFYQQLLESDYACYGRDNLILVRYVTTAGEQIDGSNQYCIIELEKNYTEIVSTDSLSITPFEGVTDEVTLISNIYYPKDGKIVSSVKLTKKS